MKVSLFVTCLLISFVSHLTANDNVLHIVKGLEQRPNDSGDRDQNSYENGGLSFLRNFDRDDAQHTSIGKHNEQDTDNVREVEKHRMSSESDATVRVKVETLKTHYADFGGPVNSTEINVIKHSPHQISARESSYCKFPKKTTDFELDCTTYPDKVVCIQTCKFGYTMEGKDGIRRKMECNKDENRWKPVAEFESCKPFIDCGVTLGPGGSYKCRKNFMHKGAECDISCLQYEDKEPVPLAKYECDIRGNWSPKLPFCARPGSGLRLVHPPRGPKTISDL